MTLRTTTISSSEAYARLREQGAGAVKYLLVRKSLMQQPTCAADVILLLVQHSAAVIARLDSWNVAGLLEYARVERNEPAYDIVADIAAARAAYVNLRDSLMARFPKDASGFLLYQQFTATGDITTRTFTQAQLADAIPLIDSVIAVLS